MTLFLQLMLILIGCVLLGVFWLIDWARDDGVRWRWMGERHGEPGYTGEISYDNGVTWEDEQVSESS